MSTVLQNISALSQGPLAIADPCVSVYHSQQHIAYRDENGIIWDSWYDGEGNWTVQQINGPGGRAADGPVAIAGPFIGILKDEQHFAYLDETGIIWDSWYDGKGNWKLQQINFLGSNDTPVFVDPNPGTLPPVVAVWTDGNGSQLHFTYRTTDFRFKDIFWDSDPFSLIGEDVPPHWTHQFLQDFNVTPGSSPVVGVFGYQQHVVYSDGDTGSLVDHWYDGDRNWNFQRITGDFDSNTNGPPTLFSTLPAVWVDDTNTQQHFTYTGVDRAIYDAFWDGGGWKLQKLTLGGQTNGPAAWSSPSVCYYHPPDADNTVYIAYLDQTGTIWTVAYNNDGWSAFQVKDLPLGGSTGATLDLPRAAGSVTAWVDVSGNQLHFTFRALDHPGPVLPPGQPLAIETSLPTLTRRATSTSPSHVAVEVVARRHSGVIWDVFYDGS